MMTKQAELKKQAYNSSLKSRALLVLLYLIDRSNQELTCFPAIPTISRELHISISTVKRALTELVNEGFIKKDMRFREKNLGQTSNLYTLVLKEKEQGGVQPAVGKRGREEESRNGRKFESAITYISFESLTGPNRKDEDRVPDPVRQEAHPADSHKAKLVIRMIWIYICTRLHYPKRIMHMQVSGNPVFYKSWTGEGVSLQPP